MAHEVGCPLARMLLMVRQRAGLSLAGALEGLRVTAADLADPQARMDWEDLTILLDRNHEAFGSDAAFEAGCAEGARLMMPCLALPGAEREPLLYFLWLQDLARALHSNLQTSITVLGDGLVQGEHCIPSPYRGSRALALASAGFFRGSTRALGLPDAEVRYSHDDRCALYRIVLPAGSSAGARARTPWDPNRVTLLWQESLALSLRFLPLGRDLLATDTLAELGRRLAEELRAHGGCAGGALWVLQDGAELLRIHTWGRLDGNVRSRLLTRGGKVIGCLEFRGPGPGGTVPGAEAAALEELLYWATLALERLLRGPNGTEAATDRVRPELTPRLRQVLALLVQGLSDKEIAQRLGTSPKTVGHQVGSLLRKCGAGNRTVLASRGLTQVGVPLGQSRAGA